MKKFFLLSIICLLTLPAIASCSLDANEPCTATLLEDPTLQEKLVPDPLEEMKEPDAFQTEYQKPYYDMLINTTPQKATNNYNSNCQFGICLPGSNNEMEEEIIE